MPELDLSGESPLSPENARRLEGVASELRSDFVALMDRLSSAYEEDIDWWGDVDKMTEDIINTNILDNNARSRFEEMFNKHGKKLLDALNAHYENPTGNINLEKIYTTLEASNTAHTDAPPKPPNRRRRRRRIG